MPSYSFKERFVPMVKDGSKRQTVRAYRKDGSIPKVGQFVHLFFGMRTRLCTRLIPHGRIHALFVQATATIYIYPTGEVFIASTVTKETAERLLSNKQLLLGDYAVKDLSQKEKNSFAWLDGFRPDGSTKDEPGEAFELMFRFWKSTHSLPFTGTVTYW